MFWTPCRLYLIFFSLNSFRYADGEMSNFSKTIICVREDHGVVESGKEKEAKNTIVSINPETQEQSVLASK